MYTEKGSENPQTGEAQNLITKIFNTIDNLTRIDTESDLYKFLDYNEYLTLTIADLKPMKEPKTHKREKMEEQYSKLMITVEKNLNDLKNLSGLKGEEFENARIGKIIEEIIHRCDLNTNDLFNISHNVIKQKKTQLAVDAILLSFSEYEKKMDEKFTLQPDTTITDKALWSFINSRKELLNTLVRMDMNRELILDAAKKAYEQHHT